MKTSFIESSKSSLIFKGIKRMRYLTLFTVLLLCSSLGVNCFKGLYTKHVLILQLLNNLVAQKKLVIFPIPIPLPLAFFRNLFFGRGGRQSAEIVIIPSGHGSGGSGSSRSVVMNNHGGGNGCRMDGVCTYTLS